MTELVTSMALPNNATEIVMAITCNEEKRIHLTEYDREPNTHVMFHVEIINCTIDMVNLNNLLNVADTKVLVIAAGINNTLTHDDSDHDQQDAMKNVASFAYINLYEHIQQLSDIFKVNVSYYLLAEITLKNISLTMLPVDIDKIFPNLQTLELSKNKFVLPPEQFPWTDEPIELPRNISRSPFFQNHYSAADHVEIPDNIFRRYFELDGNKIENLEIFGFHGMLHKIGLKSNGLHTVGSRTFSNVTGLQNLDISDNKLVILPNDVFIGLNALRKLDISGNQIVRLPGGIFDDLVSLRYLSLANNSIESIPAGMFSSLHNLQELRLEHNKLTELNPYSFPIDSINLKELHFQFNPLQYLPQFPFWIRSLVLANFHSTQISFKNFTHFLEQVDALQVYQSVIASVSSSDVSSLIEREGELRTIDLTNCNISTLGLTEHLTADTKHILLVLLVHFKFDIRNNPLICDCNINTISKFIETNEINGTLSKDEYFFKDWICQAPTELSGRHMLKVEPEETYCKVTVTDCPPECYCFKRAVVNNIIVDCRNRKIHRLHTTLPAGRLELWYGDNNITEINTITHSENIIILDVSYNKIDTVSGNVIKQMTNLEELMLHSNVLAYLPIELRLVKLVRISIWPNPFTCDCKTQWMKDWLVKNKQSVIDWYNVACKIENGDGMLILEVPDGRFVCHEKSNFDEIRHVVIPSIASSTVIICVLILTIIFYAYRLECKVLMFIYLGVHPFDNDSEKRNEDIDCVVVHSGLETDWVMEQIVSLLEHENYHFVVCDMVRDFIVGYSFQENLSRTVRHSKRMIFCLSHDWQSPVESFTIAWRIAQEKIKETKSHYGIIVSHEMKANEIEDKDLRRFIERGRFVDSTDKLFRNKIVYYMPHTQKPHSEGIQCLHFRRNSEYISRCFINSYCQVESEVASNSVIDIGANTHVFISYHDNDFQYVLKELLPLCNEKGFTYCIADRDFVPGASIDENILNAIERSHRTILILSPSHIENEWSLFTFRTAFQKSLRENSNHLLVLIKEEVEDMNLDEEIRHYLKSYICLNANDRWFQKKLFNGLPLLKNKEDLHTSPLFIKGSISIDGIATGMH